MNLISLEDARAGGYKRYYTGVPCKHGHLSERLVSNRRCNECLQNKKTVWRKSNPTLIAEAKKKWHETNPLARRVHEQNRRARKKRNGGTHTQQDIQQICEAQRMRCAVCEAKLKLFVVDHIVPLALGGSNDKFNLQVLCKKCNGSKHHKDPIAFMQERGKLF